MNIYLYFHTLHKTEWINNPVFTLQLCFIKHCLLVKLKELDRALNNIIDQIIYVLDLYSFT
jgi:hypothetical protein